MFLSQSPQCWNYRYMSSGPAERFYFWLNMTSMLLSLTICTSTTTSETPLGHKDLLLCFIILAVIFWVVYPFWVRFCTGHEAEAHCQSLVCGCPVVPAPLIKKHHWPVALVTCLVPDRSCIKIYSSSQCKGTSRQESQDWELDAACQISSVIKTQRAHGNYTAHSLLVSPGSPAQKMVLPTGRMSLSTSVNLV